MAIDVSQSGYNYHLNIPAGYDLEEYWSILFSAEGTNEISFNELAQYLTSEYFPEATHWREPITYLAGNVPDITDILNAQWMPKDKGFCVGQDGSIWLVYYSGSFIKSVQLA